MARPRNKEFNPNIKRIAFQRAGSQCSLCSCSLLGEDQIINTHYAHINGINPGSARYDANLSAQYIASTDNCIVLCASCHDKIDRKQKDDYPATQLQSLKKQAEARATQLSKPSPNTNPPPNATHTQNTIKNTELQGNNISIHQAAHSTNPTRQFVRTIQSSSISNSKITGNNISITQD